MQMARTVVQPALIKSQGVVIRQQNVLIFVMKGGNGIWPIEHTCFFLSIYTVLHPLSKIMSRHTLYTPILQDENIKTTVA